MFMFDQVHVMSPTVIGVTYFCPFLFGRVIVVQVHKDDGALPSLIFVHDQHSIVWDVDYCYECIYVFSMLNSKDPHVNNINNICR